MRTERETYTAKLLSGGYDLTLCVTMNTLTYTDRRHLFVQIGSLNLDTLRSLRHSRVAAAAVPAYGASRSPTARSVRLGSGALPPASRVPDDENIKIVSI
jgi:hypothetical protein